MTAPPPSPQQQAILEAFDQLKSGQALQINAVAGSGKTSTLLRLLEQIPKAEHAQTLFCAFNKRIVEELQARVPNSVTVKTTNALGASTLYRHFNRGHPSLIPPTSLISTSSGQFSSSSPSSQLRSGQPSSSQLPSSPGNGPQLQNNRYGRMFTLYANRFMPDLTGDQRIAFQRTLLAWLHLLRVTLTPQADFNAFKRVAETYGVEHLPRDRSAMLKALLVLLEWGRRGPPANLDPRGELHPARTVDFTDQLWLPHVLDLSPKTYQYVLVDEAQDLSSAQRELVLRSRGLNAKLVVVGDAHQAIYGFAGADFSSFERIAQATNAKRLPLSVTYRCAKTVTKLARAIVPQIKAAKGAVAGRVRLMGETQAFESFRQSDLILCRTNAPLFDAAFKLIARDQAVQVLSKDLTPSLSVILEAVSKLGPWSNFEASLERWRLEQQRGIEGAYSEAYRRALELERVDDRVACLRAAYLAGAARPDGAVALLDRFRALSVEPNLESNVRSNLEAGDTGESSSSLRSSAATGVPNSGLIRLASIHTAKGLEADRVFILKPHLLPHPMAGSALARAQEENLRYVAITRARLELVLVQAAGFEVNWEGLPKPSRSSVGPLKSTVPFAPS
jgi:DNA helicase II / ATP-dependent DNA helicase PcrA